MAPRAEQAAVQKTLENGILVRRKGHLDTGMMGTYFLVQYLQNIGRNDLLYTIVNQKTYPGWGYIVEQGGTTLWEQWNGHWGQLCTCYPAIGGWFQQGLAGILPDSAAPGFKKVVVKPSVVGDLTWVKGSYRSVHGMIVSNWRREKNVFMLDVTIPTNTTATVYVPAQTVQSVTESGCPASKTQGVKYLRMESGHAVFAVESGKYAFAAVLPQ